jgi:hypothetical protein
MSAGTSSKESDKSSSCNSTRTAARVAACIKSFAALSGKLLRAALEYSLCQTNLCALGSMTGTQCPPARHAGHRNKTELGSLHDLEERLRRTELQVLPRSEVDALSAGGDCGHAELIEPAHVR